jgi:hypothetical protein
MMSSGIHTVTKEYQNVTVGPPSNVRFVSPKGIRT